MKSKLIKAIDDPNCRLTLASWENLYGFVSYEIGVRKKDFFKLIQFNNINKDLALSIVYKLILKGKDVEKIQKILDRIERQK